MKNKKETKNDDNDKDKEPVKNPDEFPIEIQPEKEVDEPIASDHEGHYDMDGVSLAKHTITEYEVVVATANSD